MFTGLVENLGVLRSRTRRGRGADLRIVSPAADLALGESVCVSGVCLTVTATDGDMFSVNVVEETLRRTTLGTLPPGSPVNLERALRLSDRLGGHLVTGHVDCVGRIVTREPAEYGEALIVEIPRDLVRYVASKGSLALDGTSLTVGEVEDDRVSVYLIPYTIQATVAGSYRPGSMVNVEVDLISRYVERLLSADVRREEREDA